MIIKNTDGTYCKVKGIKISGLTAYVTLLVYSSVPQTTPDSFGSTSRVFSFFLKDKNSDEIIQLSRNLYWIDRVNNYENNSINVDINMHKEIILEIDITNKNKSQMKDRRWVRNCNILIKDMSNSSYNTLWTSEDLELISKEVILPEITNIKTTIDKNNVLHVTFNKTYESQEDFNYIDSNLKTVIRTKSIYNNKVIEEFVLEDDSQFINEYGQIEINSFCSKYDSPIIIEIQLLNKKKEVLYSIEKFYSTQNNLKVFIKSFGDIKQVTTCAVNNNLVTTIKIN